jgi:hypothetical protein
MTIATSGEMIPYTTPVTRIPKMALLIFMSPSTNARWYGPAVLHPSLAFFAGAGHGGSRYWMQMKRARRVRTGNRESGQRLRRNVWSAEIHAAAYIFENGLRFCESFLLEFLRSALI